MKKFAVFTFFLVCFLTVSVSAVYYSIKPNISLNGYNELIIPIGSKYEEEGAKLTILDKDIKNGYKIVGSVNTEKVGTYKIYYKSNFKYLLHKPTVCRTIKVIDREYPCINLKGSENVTLYVGDKYVEAGYEANDNYDGNITSKVKIKNNINTKKPGSYDIEYKVLDSSKNESTVVRHVTVKPKSIPVISNKVSNKTSNIVSNKTSNIVSNKVSNIIIKSNSNLNNKKMVSNSNKNKKKVNYVNKIPVFTFHRLVPDDIKNKYYNDDVWVGSVKVFESMMKYLHDNGYKTISTIEFYDWYSGKTEYDKKVVLITFDDGFYEDYYLAYPILKKYNLKSTSFIVGSRVEPVTHEYMSDDESYKNDTTFYIGQDVIDKVRREYPNFEFQSHTFDLHSKVLQNGIEVQKVLTQTDEELDKDTKLTLPFGFKTMAYPYGAYNSAIQNKLRENGYLVAFTFGRNTYGYATRKSDRYAINRIKIDGNATLTTLKKWLNY